MRFHVRTLMIAVAVAGVPLGLVAHVRALLWEYDDFALGVLILEGIGMAVLGAITCAVGAFVRGVRIDDAYAAQLRRRATPARSPWPVADAEPPNSP